MDVKKLVGQQLGLRMADLLLDWQKEIIQSMKTQDPKESARDCVREQLDSLSQEIDDWLGDTSIAAIQTDGTSPTSAESNAKSAAFRKKKRKNGITGAIFYIFLIAMVILAQSIFGNGDEPHIFLGHAVLTILSDSMKSELPRDSLVIVRHVDPNTIQIGDNITFLVNSKTSVTHKVVNIIENYGDTGVRGFQTKGVDNKQPDREIVSAVNVLGKVVFHIPMIGAAASWVGGNILLLLVITIGMIGLLFSLYKTLRWLFQPNSPKEG